MLITLCIWLHFITKKTSINKSNDILKIFFDNAFSFDKPVVYVSCLLV